ncbi:MAG: ABC transporter substrate-binding protein, partial [Dehalococcoidia bacterium]|nr:ABC transporter substrate-binding protein [Dehalococcoidia bacterium]
MAPPALERSRHLPRVLLALPALLLAAAFLLGACGDDDDAQTAGPVTINLWHSMRSPLEGALQRIVDEFNQSQTQYRVEPVFQGSYTESLNKLISTVRGGDSPSLIQLDDVSTQIMIDSGAIVPVQDFIDEESFDLSDFDPKALGYYTVDDTLYSMPFNLAGPILYYDRQDFQEAGLDPDRPPQTLEEVRQYSEQLTRRNESGDVERYGIALQISPWQFEQMIAKQDALYVNNANGREDRATEAMFAGPEGQQIIQWYHDMVEDGVALNVGRRSEDALLAVAQDRASMAIESTAALGAAVALISIIGEDPQRLGTGPMPAPEGDGGIALGGASLWIMNVPPEDEQRGAWEFIKFATSPDQQAQWHADTGYFLVRLSAYDLPPAVERREQFPQFETAVQQLRDSPDTPATRGALIGPFQAVRDRITDAFEEVLIGGAEPATELQAAADDAKSIASGEASAMKSKDGTGLINLGYAFVTMDQFDKGLDLIQK